VKTIAAPAMAAIEAGEAIVTGAFEITPWVEQIAIFGHDAEWDYFIDPAIVDADPPEDVVVPSVGFASTGTTPFGNDSGTLTGVINYPIVSAWLPNDSLWLKRDVVLDYDGTLMLSGQIENAVVFYWDDEYAGSFNPTNVQLGGMEVFSVSFAVTAGSHTLKVLCLDETSGGAPGSDNTYFYAIATLATNGAVAAGTPIRLWGGYGPIDIDGATFQGIGARGLAQQNAGAVGGIAQGLTLTVSGVEPAALQLLDADEIKGAPVVLYRMIFAGDGKTLLDAHVFDRGRVDAVDTDETIGGEAMVSVDIESAARGLGRLGGRRRSDSDQRLIDADDGYFKNTSYAGQKTLYWGGKKPTYGGGR
jgi:hypothetical protein